MIRGGVEYNLGIFITGVDKDSVADRAGLMVKITIIYISLNLISYLKFENDWIAAKSSKPIGTNNPMMARPG